MQKGVTLILTLIVTILGLVITLGAAEILVTELVASRNIHRSTVAFYVADAGIEAALYEDRIGGGLAAGFQCLADGDGVQEGGNNEDGDTCLDRLDNNGFYTYTVVGPIGGRTVTAVGNYEGAIFKRSIEINY